MVRQDEQSVAVREDLHHRGVAVGARKGDPPDRVAVATANDELAVAAIDHTALPGRDRLARCLALRPHLHQRQARQAGSIHPPAKDPSRGGGPDLVTNPRDAADLVDPGVRCHGAHARSLESPIAARAG